MNTSNLSTTLAPPAIEVGPASANTCPVSAFKGHKLVARGPMIDVALALKDREDDHQDPSGWIILGDDGRVVELDLRGSREQVCRRLGSGPASGYDEPAAPTTRARGRPRLGVVAREVTLLPRHWEWLSTQPGGASVALRKLVEQARREAAPQDQRRRSQEAAYRAMSCLAGDLPGYEEALRALFAADSWRFEAQVAAWPVDVRDYVRRLAFGDARASTGAA